MSKQQIKVAYIVPVYNVNKYLKECLDSLNNIKTPKEVIIVDDRGTENPYPIIEPFLKDDVFKYVRNSKNLGLGFARNEGIKKISDDVTHVYFIDSDDYVDSKNIDISVRKFGAECTYLLTKYFDFTKKEIIPMNSSDHTLSPYPYSVCGSFWHADTAKKITFKSRTFEDALWVIEFLKSAKTSDVDHLKVETYFYRKRMSSIMNAKRKGSIAFDFVNEYIAVINSGLHGWNYAKSEEFFFAYYRIDKKKRKEIVLPDFGLSIWQKLWISFAYHMQRIVNFEKIIARKSKKDFFE